jgi:alkanesulfonate monooxygenase SsuD/methylene tetrahydromethanopterin reductase-like flavin-dependent oxidoreductase (luciferase family)
MLHLAPEIPRVLLGIGTVNPSARHPAVIAASAGFLSQLTGGRFSLGIGSSTNPQLHPVGLDVAGQVPRCREAIRIIRHLLEHGGSTFSGEMFSTVDAKLLFEGGGPVPILVGASGAPRMLKMSGEEAHGVIIPAGNRVFYRYAVDAFRRSMRESGRVDEGSIVLNGNIAVSDDSSSALRSIKPLVADAIAHRAVNKHSLHHMGITLEQANAWRDDPDSLPDEVTRESAIAGTPDECVEGLIDLSRWGITQLAIRFPEEATVRAVGENVLPRLRERLSGES